MCAESSSFSWMLRTESKIDVSHVFDLVKQTRVAVAHVEQHVTRMSSGDFFFCKVALALLALRGVKQPAKTDEVQSGNQSNHSECDSMNGNLKPSCVLCFSVIAAASISEPQRRTSAPHSSPGGPPPLSAGWFGWPPGSVRSARRATASPGRKRSWR